MAIKKRLQKAASSFAFWFYIEIMHDEVIKGLRNYLASIQPEDIARMVREGEFPPFEDLDFSAVGDNVEHLEKVPLFSPNDDGDPPGLVEWLAEARPDLVKEIQDMGKQGAEYLVKLRLHILGLLKHTEFKPEEDVVLASCDKCGKKWPVKKDEASSITKCPFCGNGEDEPKEPPAEEEE